jgi:hypothetical protein
MPAAATTSLPDSIGIRLGLEWLWFQTKANKELQEDCIWRLVLKKDVESNL